MTMNVLSPEQKEACPEAQHWVSTFDADSRAYQRAAAQRMTEAEMFLTFYDPSIVSFVAEQDNISPEIKQTFNILAAAQAVRQAVAQEDSIAYVAAHQDLSLLMQPPRMDMVDAEKLNAAMHYHLARELVDDTCESARFRAKEVFADSIVQCLGKTDGIFEEYIQLKSQDAFDRFIELEDHYRGEDQVQLANRNLRKAFGVAAAYDVKVNPSFWAHAQKYLSGPSA